VWFVSQQIGKWSRLWFWSQFIEMLWLIHIFYLHMTVDIASQSPIFEWVMLWKWQYFYITQPLSCCFFHLPNLLLTQNFVYPTLFSSVPPPAINNDRSLTLYDITIVDGYSAILLYYPDYLQLRWYIVLTRNNSSSEDFRNQKNKFVDLLWHREANRSSFYTWSKKNNVEWWIYGAPMGYEGIHR
jgi:hypothetical protein